MVIAFFSFLPFISSMLSTSVSLLFLCYFVSRCTLHYYRYKSNKWQEDQSRGAHYSAGYRLHTNDFIQMFELKLKLINAGINATQIVSNLV